MGGEKKKLRIGDFGQKTGNVERQLEVRSARLEVTGGGWKSGAGRREQLVWRLKKWETSVVLVRLRVGGVEAGEDMVYARWDLLAVVGDIGERLRGKTTQVE